MNMNQVTKARLSAYARLVAVFAVVLLVVSQTAPADVLKALLILIAFGMAATLWFKQVRKSHGLGPRDTVE